MFQNISRILKLIEEGKIDANKAVELIHYAALPVIIL